jgi:branched-chain amino acid transport system substrate-binding protein
MAKREGGVDKLKGKKIALVYHDSPYGKEPIPMLQERAKMHGFDLTCCRWRIRASSRRRPGCRSASRPPDYVLLWGWGVMNSTASRKRRPRAIRATR